MVNVGGCLAGLAKARAKKNRYKLNWQQTAATTKKNLGLPQSLRRLSPRERYTAEEQLQSLPETLTIARGTRQPVRQGKRATSRGGGGDRGAGQKGQVPRPTGDAARVIGQAPVVQMTRRSSPWCVTSCDSCPATPRRSVACP